MRRIKIKIIKPNTLFETWLEEWRDEAVSRNSQLQYHFSMALEALRKYPLPLETGKDCMILQHFGSKLCAMIDKKLEQYQIERCHKMPIDVNVEQSMEVDNGDGNLGGINNNDHVDQVRKEFKKHEAIIILNDELIFDETNWPAIRNDSSMNEPSSIKYTRIIGDKDSIHIAGCSKNASIVPLWEEPTRCPSNCTDAQIVPLDKESMSIPSRSSSFETPVDFFDEPIRRQSSFSILPKNFNVILLVDTQEVQGTKREYAVTGLFARDGINFEIRHLHVGDFIWIAQCRDTKRELVLPYIVERKRMDDFASSIKDGRYHEQKFRLRHCGIHTTIYMVEKLTSVDANLSLPLSTLMQASANSMVQDNFNMKFTRNHRDSLLYLSTVTKVIEKVFENKLLKECDKGSLRKEFNIKHHELHLMEFTKFNRTSAKIKPLTVREMFINHLLQIKGLSFDGTRAIVERYPTPSLLKEAFHAAGEEGEQLLVNLQYGKTRRKLGPVMAKIIYQLYTKNELS